MNRTIIFAFGAAVAGVTAILLWSSLHPTKSTPGEVPTAPIASATVVAPTNLLPPKSTHPKVKTRASEFNADEQKSFAANFEKRYKPAISNWCKAFGGHVPLKPADVNTNRFVERVGVDS
jgi:hypothetical protein